MKSLNLSIEERKNAIRFTELWNTLSKTDRTQLTYLALKNTKDKTQGTNELPFKSQESVKKKSDFDPDLAQRNLSHTDGE